MKRKRQPLVICAVIAMAALIGACGSSASSQIGSGSNAAANAKQAVKFASCMRKNGISAFPDPSGSGNFTIDEVANGSSLDTSSPAFIRALTACKDLEPAGFTGSKWNSQQMKTARKFAQCIRENGVTDFPDPINGQPLVDTNRIPSTNQPGGMSALRTAMNKCSSLSAKVIGSEQ